MKKIAFIFVVLVATAVTSYFPVRTVTKVKARCEQCLCVNAPTCSDVVVVQRGMPFALSYTLVEPEYVEEPYKSQYAKKMIPLNMLMNGLVAAVAVGMPLYVIKRRN